MGFSCSACWLSLLPCTVSISILRDTGSPHPADKEGMAQHARCDLASQQRMLLAAARPMQGTGVDSERAPLTYATKQSRSGHEVMECWTGDRWLAMG